MVSTYEKFAELEIRIVRTIELVKTTRQERDAVAQELAVARNRIAGLEREVEELRQERELVKNRVESLVESLSELTEETLV